VPKTCLEGLGEDGGGLEVPRDDGGVRVVDAQQALGVAVVGGMGWDGLVGWCVCVFVCLFVWFICLVGWLIVWLF
jgi:hypothetical protein